ncbi:unnamed protein product [Phyllotreta striolata]|uniref:Regulatory protein zeste n=1 Tax=Phyllotreta striolata TaxID=444603 RepID=A0A9N9TNH9_PHYSR|nr:unnamed protein product [Phyllotreta striolata]
MEKKRCPKTTKSQYLLLLEFLQDNRIIITGKTAPQDRLEIEQLWKEFANRVNSKPVGPPKTWEQWRQVYTDWKANTKKKSKRIMLNADKTGPEECLNDIEEGLLSLITNIHFGADADVINDVNDTTQVIILEEPSDVQNIQNRGIKRKLKEEIYKNFPVEAALPAAPSRETPRNAKESLVGETSRNVGRLADAAERIADSLEEIKNCKDKKNRLLYFKMFNTLEGYEDF